MKVFQKTFNGHLYSVYLQQCGNDFLVTSITDGIQTCCAQFGIVQSAKAEFDRNVQLLKTMKQ